MKKNFGLILLIVVVFLVSVGFFRGWFSISSNRETLSNKVDLSFTVDPDKVRKDAEQLKANANELTGSRK